MGILINFGWELCLSLLVCLRIELGLIEFVDILFMIVLIKFMNLNLFFFVWIIWFMYICGLILFCMMFIYDFFLGFDFLVFLCLIFYVCARVFLMKRMSNLNSCVVDFNYVFSFFYFVKIDKLIFKILRWCGSDVAFINCQISFYYYFNSHINIYCVSTLLHLLHWIFLLSE